MLYTALIFGLVSSFHCVAMCGPIAVMLPLDRRNEAKRVVQLITYFLGKTLAYASLGLLFGIVGKGFFLGGMQQQLSIIVGFFIIIIAIVPEKQFAKYNFSKPIYKLIGNVKATLGKQFKKQSYQSLFTIGLLNGYLPCGMVYMAVFGALAMNKIYLSISYMIFFGIGTIPLLSVVVLFSKLASIPFKNKIRKIIPVVAVLVGVLFIIRGLGLNIPYLSPGTMNLFVQENANCN